MRENDPSLDGLAADFRPIVEQLIVLCAERKIFVVPHDMLRSFERQAKLFALGPGVTRAGPGESAHNWGRAADFILDVHRLDVRTRPWTNPRTKVTRMYPDAWDNDTPAAAATWVRFGEAAEELGLTWGGRWRRPVDVPHVEDPLWRAKRPADWRSIVAAELGR